ncbi:alpha/beta hydrolase [Actinomadura sp. 7K534]|uniref:alpha/beta fold hydrolase n=1 Tax=Actinomadura sp. 7K534 TaxID=2530366 RepID=UPI0010483121|nr:alpha/beta hydrolase [Actinomadura sp. 7K534]TDB98858.1 alpha/beta hydrolase [Actinomadura sp. 7K534]
MGSVKSKDGTLIAYERLGSGPPVILVGGGGGVDRSENAPLARELAKSLTVFNYDRRGRGESGDTLPYALEREFDDLAALIDEAGGSAHLYGVSSGGALALEAVLAGLPVDRVGVYEVPYDVHEGAPDRHRQYTEELHRLLGEDRRGDAFELFMRLAGSSDDDVAAARGSEFWPQCEAVAHTLAYDNAAMGDGALPAERLAGIRQPVLVATGGSLDPHMAALGSFFDDAADALAEAIPDAERVVIPHQGHVADAEAVAPVLVPFLTAS